MTVAAVLVAAVALPLASIAGQPVINADDYISTDCSQAVANYTGLQNAVNALGAGGGTIEFNAGTYCFASGAGNTGRIDVPAPVRFVGQGPNATLLHVASMGAGNVFFNVTSEKACAFAELGIQSTLTSGAAVYVDPGAGKANTGTTFLHVQTYGFGTGLYFHRALEFRILDSTFQRATDEGILVRNATNADAGDSIVQGSVFDAKGSATFNGITWKSSGGLKVTGCKTNGGRRGIYVNPESGTPTVILTVSASSIENFDYHGIEFAGDVGTLRSINIVGNEFASWVGTPIASSSAVFVNAANVKELVVTGNTFFMSHPTSASAVAVHLVKGRHALVAGNLFSTEDISPLNYAIAVQSEFENAFVGENQYVIPSANMVPIYSRSATTRVSSGFGRSLAALNSELGIDACSTLQDGSSVWCSDCTPSCAPGGSGARIQRVSGTWRCN